MDEKRLEILERVSIIYMKYGIKSITMDDLARELAISKKTIYRYFKDKNQLVHSIIEMKIKMDQAICTNNAQQSISAIEEMFSVMRFVMENIGNINPTVFYDLQKYHPHTWKVIEDHKWIFVLNMITKNIERGIKEGVYRKNLITTIIAKQYVVSTDMIMNPSIFPWPEFQFDVLFKEIMEFQLNGMVNEKGRILLSKSL